MRNFVNVQYVYNICLKFQIDCLKILGVADDTNLLAMLKANLKIVKLFFLCKNSHAHLQYVYNIYVKFQTDCFKTLGAVDYTNLNIT